MSNPDSLPGAMNRRLRRPAGPTPETRQGRRVSRLQIITGVLGGITGLAASPVLGGLGRAQAAGYTEDDSLNFVAEGPANTAFAGTAVDQSGNPVFQNGVAVNGSRFGVLAQSPNVGVRGGGDNNTTGVMGISFSDATEKTHGSGSGVEGHSGTGAGVAGFSDAKAGVYGMAGGVSGVGVSGKGATGVSGYSDAGVGVLGSSSSGQGVSGQSASGSGVAAGSVTGAAVTAITSALDQPAILAQNAAVVRKGSADKGAAAGGIRGESGHSYGVAGVTTAPPGELGVGSGIAGIHGNGYGAGVAGFSLTKKSPGALRRVPESTGVYGAGQAAGVAGSSGAGGQGVRGVNVGGGTGMVGSSFADSTLTKAGSGTGVQGTSGAGSGVAGFSNSGTGVYGQSASSHGTGVKGEATHGIGVTAVARSRQQPALYAQNSKAGSAIAADSALGYGAEMRGGKAAMRLVPQPETGSPRAGSHQVGELIVDAKGDLYFCARSGRPGTWRKVVLA